VQKCNNTQANFFRRIVVLFCLLLFPICSFSHGGSHDESIGWMSWTFSWPVFISLLLISVYYLSGWKRVESKNRFDPLRRWQLVFFISGLVILIAALLSPIDRLSDYLAYVHMIQHTLLLMVAAPLFALASPGFYSFRQLPKSLKSGMRPLQKTWFQLTRAFPMKRMLVAWVAYALILWIWHIPYLYEAALKNSLVHDLQHLAFFISAYFFWRVVIDPFRKPGRNEGVAILYVFVASLHAMILGVLMTLAPSSWYPSYEKTAPLFGLTALEDQQIAGLIMWMPAGVSYVLVALGSLYMLLKRQSSLGQEI